MSCRTWDLALLQNFVKQLPVLCRIHVFCGRAQDRHAHFHQRFCQLDGRLAAELYHCAVGLLQPHDGLHILRRQRLKIQLIRDIKVGAHRFRVIVDNDGFKTFF